ncbi:hypothetical protein [Anaeromyxobacter diazotrophicus]|uniref:Uncharacterized protein n=1 Tax=Anaeromyxobacter diazotrophicus TaxID=2590199 RepID=A0A7I9VJ98_9BACT|nr:hypothetical protein [Anaeromyxobacter diazotrophicus]GEJ56484.1 hypothetical protein AMYX_12250 [Anaeromyxobacter diazotrophicus]
MHELAKGKLVQHASLGIGKIVALEANAVHVFFPDSDKRFAAKLRLPAAQALLRTDGLEQNSWLEGLSAFALDPKTGRYGLAASWLSHDEALAQFLSAFPEGFTAAAAPARGGPGESATRWRAAQAAFAKGLGDGKGERLAAGDDVEGLVERALAIDKLLAPLHSPADVGAVKKAFAEEGPTAAYFGALFELLSGPAQGRAPWEKLFAAAGNLPVAPAQQWLVATLFPFLASPREHVLLRPRVTCEAAERLGSDLRFQTTPNWVTYRAARSLATRLLQELQASGAQDFVDVEIFLQVTASAKRTLERAGRAAATPKRSGAREARPRAAKRSTP